GAENRFVQIYLPVHEPAGDQKFFDAVDGFLFHHELIFANVQHFNDAVAAYYAFAHTGKKTVTFQVIQPVHIKLRTYKLVEEMFFIPVVENFNGKSKFPFKLLVQPAHDHAADGFMRDAAHKTVFEGV